MGAQLHDRVVISLQSQAELRTFQGAVVTAVPLKQTLNCNLPAAIFRERGGGAEVL